MADRLRFHLDEQVDSAIARALRSAGIDATTTEDTGLRSSDDADQLAFANADGRVLVTDDADFLHAAADGASHKGIVFCHRRFRTMGDIIRTLVGLYQTYTPEELHNRVVHVTRQ